MSSDTNGLEGRWVAEAELAAMRGYLRATRDENAAMLAVCEAAEAWIDAGYEWTGDGRARLEMAVVGWKETQRSTI